MWNRRHGWGGGARPAACQSAQGPTVRGTHVNDGLLALDGNPQRVPADLHIQILALVLGLD